MKLRDKLEAVVGGEHETKHDDTVVDEILTLLHEAASRSFIVNTAAWLQQVKDGREFSIR